MIKLLIKHGADPLAQDSRKFQPIHAAAESGTMETVECFLGKGARVEADVNDKDDYFQNGWQPLHLAANRQDADESAQKVCRLLLAKGADPNALTGNPGPETPLDIAVFYNRRTGPPPHP